MATNVRGIDVESPRPLELTFAPFIKDDEPSVATHLSDGDSSEFEPSTHSRPRYVTPLRKLALVAIVATLLGVSAGFGARRIGESKSSQSMANPVSGETTSMETVAATEEGHRAGQFVFNPNPQTTAPVYSLTASQTTIGYGSRVDDPVTGTSVGVITSQTARPSQTTPPSQTSDTTPPFNGIVGVATTSQPEGWPELVGLPGETAKKIIEDEGRGFTVIIVPPGGVTTKDWRHDRVFIYVNDQQYVSSVPYPGR